MNSVNSVLCVVSISRNVNYVITCHLLSFVCVCFVILLGIRSYI